MAEKHLVALAEHHDADELRVLGRRILEVVAPDLAEQFEGRLLEAEEAHAARKTVFSMREDHQGVAHGRFAIPARHAHMLRKAIQALTNPTRHTTTSPSTGTGTGPAPRPVSSCSRHRSCSSGAGSPVDPDLPAAVRDGVAFTQVLEAIQASWLPTHGGTGATVVVTMTLDQLTDQLDAAGVCPLDTGGRISAGEARRLACTAGIIPVVLGGKSVILDAGTKTRFHTEPQRIALGIRDGGCTAAGLRRPTRHVPRPPRHPLRRRRPHLGRQRTPPVRPPPPPHPRPRLHPHGPPRPEDHLPPTHLDPDARHEPSAAALGVSR